MTDVNEIGVRVVKGTFNQFEGSDKTASKNLFTFLPMTPSYI
jgi:hypothetical protein